MPLAKRKPLGSLLPPVKDVPAPTPEYLDRLDATWDARVPELRDLNNAKPLGSEQPVPPYWWWDEVHRRYIRASDGHVLTGKQLRAGFEKFLKGERK